MTLLSCEPWNLGKQWGTGVGRVEFCTLILMLILLLGSRMNDVCMCVCVYMCIYVCVYVGL